MLINRRYKVIRTLGEGGFGHAYLTEDTQMPSHRQCVVKQLKPVAAGTEIYQVVQQRFEREAAMLEKLGENHPQIPRLYAYFSENQQFYLVQEWIEGETLDALVEQGVLDEAKVIAIVSSLLKVLDFIHTQGVIHRDIKPDNVILRSHSQQPVLIDFGAMRETMGTVFNSRNHPISSIVIGTPGYMSSEQAAGRPVPSSDLYSLGLMAIYLLTGKIPQELPSDPRSGELIWQDLATHVSPQLIAVIDRAVQSHPRDRYSSALEMLSALSGFATASDAPATLMSLPMSPPTANRAAMSEVKTVAIAGSHPPYPSSSQTQQHPQSTVNQPLSQPPLAAVETSSSRLFSPWLLGTVAAVVGAIAIGGGLVFSQLSGDSAVKSASGNSAENSTKKAAKGINPVVGDRKDKLAPAADSETPPDEPTESTAQAEPEAPSSEYPQNTPDNTQVTLTGQGAGRIAIYDQPTTTANSSSYGAPGDRALSVEKTTNRSGDWNYVQLESGAEGWVQSQFIAAGSPPSAAQPSSETLPPPKAQSSGYGQLTGSGSVEVFSAPSYSASAPHYGLSGDRVVLLDSTQGDDGLTWYQVQFESGAVGWISSDFMSIP
ncbi:MAG: serine/threonine protein kinase [Leptolyngbya foveolarum]|uniref:non-specific serine/threonine protein kinase n=1 Tax=Leptolyngbya foveolarum TaxID=47253 RepID=A0A2W4UIF4_9CYAN|nr:MAG: serine/threonine protein kinase [Leptolyngbya foveolarum]